MLVIPINSPAKIAPYKWAIDHGKGNLKVYPRKWRNKSNSQEQVVLLIDNACQALNQKPRRSLGRKNVCQSNFNTQKVAYPESEHNLAQDWILKLAVEISTKPGKKIDPSACRIDARKWMEKKHAYHLQDRKSVIIYDVGQPRNDPKNCIFSRFDRIETCKRTYETFYDQKRELFD